MAALLSSPLMSTMTSGQNLVAAAASRCFDPFDQHNTPTREQDELPAEFADESFGSSMSLGSSFELSKLAASGVVLGGGEGMIGRLTETGTQAQPRRTAAKPDQTSTSFHAVRRSPPGKPQNGLGAAMGTTLNSKSPGLAVKMSASPKYMDLSPVPNTTGSGRNAPSLQLEGTPLKGTMASDRSADENLPPGSAMKEDTSAHMLESNPQRRHHSEYSAVTHGGSLGRLFGTELSMHGTHPVGGHHKAVRASLGCVFGGHDLGAGTGLGDESFNSPDKEPPAKRRPASLPVSSNPHQRPSLRSAGMGPPSFASSSANPAPYARPRPNLLKSMTTGHHTVDAKKGSLEALNQNYRASDSALLTLGGVRQARSRAGSAERMAGGAPLFVGAEQRMAQKSSLPPPSHATIAESPSPSKETLDGMAGYFFDPQSPETQRAGSQGAVALPAVDMAAHSMQPPPSIASVMMTSASARPRTLIKASSAAVVPLSSMLGKRANPYARRSGTPLAASAAAEVQTANGTGASSRLKVPAPRRCQSALDNSAAFLLAGRSDDMSMSSMDGNGSGAADCSIQDASPSSEMRGAKQHATISASTVIRLPPGFDASGSPIAPSARASSRPGLFRRPSKDDSSPLGYGKRFAAGTVTAANVGPVNGPQPGSPLGVIPNCGTGAGGLEHHMPGFGASEREGKILPCYSVKDDGLMRITPETLRAVMDGKFDDKIDGFQVVDCRFGYEYEGGHVPGAINLSTLQKVKKHFLEPEDVNKLPPRSQSGKADAHGRMRKKVIVFHCEFSVKRAPSSALALRQADRALAHDYPNCHYPEVYVLQGGYSGFFKRFPDVCEPRAYIQMDDPRYLHKRSVELNGFRKQFSRHKSFAYGDGSRQTQSDGQVIKRAGQERASQKDRLPSGLSRTIREEDDSTSSSFDNSISSPSAVQANAVHARRQGLARHATSASVLASSSTFGSTLGFKPVLTKGEEGKPAPTCIGDLSFGSSCSIADDTSFDVSLGGGGAVGESPCGMMNGQQGKRCYTRLAPGRRD